MVGRTTAWPRLETGNSSVTPWTTPITSAWKYVSMQHPCRRKRLGGYRSGAKRAAARAEEGIDGRDLRVGATQPGRRRLGTRVRPGGVGAHRRDAGTRGAEPPERRGQDVGGRARGEGTEPRPRRGRTDVQAHDLGKQGRPGEPVADRGGRGQAGDPSGRRG